MALFGSCYGERWFSVFFFLVCFFVCLLPYGASCSTAYRCIRLCTSFFFVFSAFRGQASFFFGVWPVGFAWFRREKLLFDFLVFYCLL